MKNLRILFLAICLLGVYGAQAQITVTFSTNGPSCNGVCDAGSMVIPAGGTTPYTYNWSSGETSAGISSKCAGMYYITVTDAIAQTKVDSVDIAVTPVFDADIQGENAWCPGEVTGYVSSNPVNGSAPYTYVWSSGETTSSISNAPLGTYVGTVTDVNGCVDMKSVTVSALDDYVINITATTPSCNGDANGTMTAIVTGGTSFYNYGWSNQQWDQTITGLSAGVYSVSISDSHECMGPSLSFTLTELAVLNAGINSYDINCNGANDGIDSSFVSGGTTPYAYTWTNGATTPQISGLSQGSYQLTATDANGCTANGWSYIYEPTPLTVTTGSADDSCGTAIGSAYGHFGGGDLTPARSVLDFTYVWNTGATTDSIVGLTPGTYSITATNGLGCSLATNVFVFGSIDPTLVSTVTNVDCFNNPTGVVEIDFATGGGADYLWSNGAITKDIGNLTDGVYSVTATNESGCIEYGSYTVTEPGLLLAMIGGSNETCDMQNGVVDVTVTGGTTPYTYAWDNAATVWQLTGLVAGTYSVAILDANGCSGNTSGSIQHTDGPVLSTVTVANQSCFENCDGLINISAAGGLLPYSYVWSNASTTEDLADLCAGAYEVIMTDNNGCKDTLNHTITTPATVEMTLAVSNSTCGNTTGSVIPTVVGGTLPYTYAWTNGSNASGLANTGADIYGVTVTDANGCSVVGEELVTDSDGPVVTVATTSPAYCGGADGYIDIDVTGGTSPFSYFWSNDATTEDLVAASGNYSALVIDDLSCYGGVIAAIANNGTTPPQITGNVSIILNGFTVTGGMVYLYENTGDTIVISDSTAINVDGTYLFDNVLPVGDYSLIAVADEGNFPNAIPTYADSTYKWFEAAIVSVDCDNVYTNDIGVVDLTPLNGASDVSGNLSYVGTGKNSMAGDPIPGIDISLEQVPGGIVASTETDGGGNYDFTNVPTGTTFTYTLYVDFPGRDQIDTYTLNTSNTDTTYADLDFLVSDTTVYIDESTGLVKTGTLKDEVKLWPNPNNGETLKLALPYGNTIWAYELYDMYGKLVYRENLGVNGGFKVVNLPQVAKGIYHVKISNGKLTDTERLILK